MKKLLTLYSLFICSFSLVTVGTPSLTQAEPSAVSAKAQRTVDFWTQSRRDAATPRDLFLDKQGNAYIRDEHGLLEPYGRELAAGLIPLAKPANPGGGNGGGDSGDSGQDNIAPEITDMIPAAGAVLNTDSVSFAARVTDDVSGVKSVSVVITTPTGSETRAYSASHIGDNIWQLTLYGFTSGHWKWHVIAKDNGPKGGNVQTSAKIDFSIDLLASSPSNPDVVSNGVWQNGGAVQSAAGRIYFEMPAKRKGTWNGYVCSGTAVTDNSTNRSVIITAAHCVYDDTNKAFARNVLFIPNQASTTGSGTDLNCNNDPIGCWVPSFGVVDNDWTTRTFPDNKAWDYAWYVVSDTNSHIGAAASSPALDESAGSLVISFTTPVSNDGEPGKSSADFTHALGYSYDSDPNLMYCAEDMSTQGSDNWWLASCGMTGGSSGGPWVQTLDTVTGDGPIVSVNSWGYAGQPGMAGPMLDNAGALCVFDLAKSTAFTEVSSVDGEAGIIANCN